MSVMKPEEVQISLILNEIEGTLTQARIENRLPTEKEMFDVRSHVLEAFDGVRRIGRRRMQEQELSNSADDTFPSWLAVGETVNEFIADLVFHAKRLQRPVRGYFNAVLLAAWPSSTEDEVGRQYTAVMGGRR